MGIAAGKKQQNIVSTTENVEEASNCDNVNATPNISCKKDEVNRTDEDGSKSSDGKSQSKNAENNVAEIKNKVSDSEKSKDECAENEIGTVNQDDEKKTDTDRKIDDSGENSTNETNGNKNREEKNCTKVGQTHESDLKVSTIPDKVKGGVTTDAERTASPGKKRKDSPVSTNEIDPQLDDTVKRSKVQNLDNEVVEKANGVLGEAITGKDAVVA